MAGLGWAVTLGCLALCALILLSASLAFDAGGAGTKPSRAESLRGPSVPDAELQRVPLGRLRGTPTPRPVP